MLCFLMGPDAPTKWQEIGNTYLAVGTYELANIHVAIR